MDDNVTDVASGARGAPKLRCLPYYYLLGDFNCGQRDLHSRLLQARALEKAARAHRKSEREREGLRASERTRRGADVALPAPRRAAPARGALRQQRAALVGRKQALGRVLAPLRKARPGPATATATATSPPTSPHARACWLA
jgi:hypothetical protein